MTMKPNLAAREWRNRWAIGARDLGSDYDFSNFRAHHVIEGIETSVSRVPIVREIAQTLGVPPEFFKDPLIGNPKHYNGVTGNSIRMATFSHRILSWYRATRNASPIRVVEIGGGYGHLAYALQQRIPVAQYTVIDAEPMLRLVRYFTAHACPDLEVRTIDRNEYTLAPTADLFVNINSFGEMQLTDVQQYFELIQDRLVESGALYTWNRIKRGVSFHEYPYDEHWHHDVRVHKIAAAFGDCLSVRDLSASNPPPF